MGRERDEDKWDVVGACCSFSAERMSLRKELKHGATEIHEAVQHARDSRRLFGIASLCGDTF